MQFFRSMFIFTINGHPEDKEGHTVEFSTAPNGESEATLASSKLHGKVLVVLSQVRVNLLVLLEKVNFQVKQLIFRLQQQQLVAFGSAG